MGFNSRWGSIVSIFVFDWGSINIFMGWGCNQEWGSNGADTVAQAIGGCATAQHSGNYLFVDLKARK